MQKIQILMNFTAALEEFLLRVTYCGQTETTIFAELRYIVEKLLQKILTMQNALFLNNSFDVKSTCVF